MAQTPAANPLSTEQTAVLADFARTCRTAARSVSLYPAMHPSIQAALSRVTAAAGRLVSAGDVTLAVYPDTLAIDGQAAGRADGAIGEFAGLMHDRLMGKLTRQLQQLGIERIVIDQGVQPAELTQLVQTLGAATATADSTTGLSHLKHIRVGRLQLEERGEAAAPVGDISTCRRLYDDAVSIASTLWDSAKLDGMPDADAGRGIVDSLVQEVSQNRTALLALTALKDYDSYTFTHMVNVSILTMGQARGLGMEGPLLREFGLSALLHDIGKVKTPADMLNKTGKLTDQEFEILRRHTVEGAEILRRTPEIPALAPVVAFEHHLRLDGTGYPAGVSRPTLNLGTMLCGIADVYDAMRSQRVYQEAFPTDRILAVLQRNDGTQFDQHLVRRFVQLVGIYPAGNLVRLDTEEVAVVLKTYAPDPYRPRVRLLLDRAGAKIDRVRELNLWETPESEPRSIQAPLDPADYDFDPLTYLQTRDS
ncbi:MAG: HD-GYP domain-containing protein [Acidobacteria bacterium]|nr:HD-GYP domain-containing protein [Acidobacteriota bacterium]